MHHSLAHKNRDLYILVLAIKYFISGCIFGGLSLNTKITNLAILPYLIFSSYLQIKKSPFYANKTYIYVILIGFLCLGIIVTHSPWIFLYWVYTLKKKKKTHTFSFSSFSFLFLIDFNFLFIFLLIKKDLQ